MTAFFAVLRQWTQQACPSPKIRAGLLSPWREPMMELAKRENVYCKVSSSITSKLFPAPSQQITIFWGMRIPPRRCDAPCLIALGEEDRNALYASFPHGLPEASSGEQKS
jgi:hypothetical protein